MSEFNQLKSTLLKTLYTVYIDIYTVTLNYFYKVYTPLNEWKLYLSFIDSNFAQNFKMKLKREKIIFKNTDIIHLDTFYP